MGAYHARLGTCAAWISTATDRPGGIVWSHDPPRQTSGRGPGFSISAAGSGYGPTPDARSLILTSCDEESHRSVAGRFFTQVQDDGGEPPRELALLNSGGRCKPLPCGVTSP